MNLHRIRALTLAAAVTAALGLGVSAPAEAAPVAQTAVAGATISATTIATTTIATTTKYKSKRKARVTTTFAQQVTNAAAAVAGAQGVGVSWVRTTSCGQAGYVSRKSISVRGCSMPGTNVIELSIGGGNPAGTRVSRAQVLALVTAVAQHEVAHRLIERRTGTLYPVARSENVADAYAATFLGMNARYASYGYDGNDVATAQRIQNGTW